MAHLTRPKVYDINDSNIALLGSDLEKHVREQAGNIESAWENAGSTPGLKTWRIEKFQVVPWPEDKRGTFYDGDSYIVLHTYKKHPESKSLSFDLHFWLGENTTQDEAGTAAYKTVELDDHLHGKPVQYREIQGFESTRFLSYFPQFVCMKGGVATGFHHISAPPPLNVHKLYKISLFRNLGSTNLIVRDVVPKASSLVAGDVYVLDKGAQVWQFNTKTSAGKERFKAAEFVQGLLDDRKGQSDVTVFEEGQLGAGVFLAEFGEGTVLQEPEPSGSLLGVPPVLLRVSDATGKALFEVVEPPLKLSLDSSDAFLLDHSSNVGNPAIYVWLGKGASLNERHLALQYAQTYLYNKQERAGKSTVQVAIPVIRMNEGDESEGFLEAIGA